MIPIINLINKPDFKRNVIFLSEGNFSDSDLVLPKKEKNYLKNRLKNDAKSVDINLYGNWLFYRVVESDKPEWQTLENIRKTGSKLYGLINEFDITEIHIAHKFHNEKYLMALAEGLILSSYRFDKYISSKKNKKELKKITAVLKKPDKESWNRLTNTLAGVFQARDLINEPVSWLNASRLASEFVRMGKEAGFSVKVYNKKEIARLKMGGLLAVNSGSIDPPTFSVMEWKPAKAVNKEPVVLVGKGIVYDTGGLSLKPTTDSMDYMKSDMSGAAAVAGIMYAVATSRLPLHVVALVPATDNRPSGNAYAPGDIIRMMDGTFVEMLNADAEGRMILADALHFAKKYKPLLVVDFATLTGSAIAALGKLASAAFEKSAGNHYNKLEQSGYDTCERLVLFPLWEDYAEMLESKIADIKNVGGKHAGAITAAKFLERFTDYPWIHLDIAGPAYNFAKDSYRSAGGTGTGIRLIMNFFCEQFLK